MPVGSEGGLRPRELDAAMVMLTSLEKEQRSGSTFHTYSQTSSTQEVLRSNIAEVEISSYEML